MISSTLDMLESLTIYLRLITKWLIHYVGDLSAAIAMDFLMPIMSVTIAAEGTLPTSAPLERFISNVTGYFKWNITNRLPFIILLGIYEYYWIAGILALMPVVGSLYMGLLELFIVMQASSYTSVPINRIYSVLQNGGGSLSETVASLISELMTSSLASAAGIPGAGAAGIPVPGFPGIPIPINIQGQRASRATYEELPLVPDISRECSICESSERLVQFGCRHVCCYTCSTACATCPMCRCPVDSSLIKKLPAASSQSNFLGSPWNRSPSQVPSPGPSPSPSPSPGPNTDDPDPNTGAILNDRTFNALLTGNSELNALLNDLAAQVN